MWKFRGKKQDSVGYTSDQRGAGTAVWAPGGCRALLRRALTARGWLLGAGFPAMSRARGSSCPFLVQLLITMRSFCSWSSALRFKLNVFLWLVNAATLLLVFLLMLLTNTSRSSGSFGALPAAFFSYSLCLYQLLIDKKLSFSLGLSGAVYTKFLFGVSGEPLILLFLAICLFLLCF